MFGRICGNGRFEITKCVVFGRTTASYSGVVNFHFHTSVEKKRSSKTADVFQ